MKILYSRKLYKECIINCLNALKILDNNFTNIKLNEYSKRLFQHKYIIFNARKRINLAYLFETLANCLIKFGNL